MIDLKTHRKNRRHLKNTKNKVPRSDIGYISMISIGFDRIFGDFDISFVKKVRVFIQINENPSKSPEIAENPIKNGRDRREIRDIRLRDHFFRVQSCPKTFPCVWELLGVRKLRNIQANAKNPSYVPISPDIDTHLLERTFKRVFA